MSQTRQALPCAEARPPDIHSEQGDVQDRYQASDPPARAVRRPTEQLFLHEKGKSQLQQASWPAADSAHRNCSLEPRCLPRRQAANLRRTATWIQRGFRWFCLGWRGKVVQCPPCLNEASCLQKVRTVSRCWRCLCSSARVVLPVRISELARLQQLILPVCRQPACGNHDQRSRIQQFRCRKLGKDCPEDCLAEIFPRLQIRRSTRQQNTSCWAGWISINSGQKLPETHVKRICESS